MELKLIAKFDIDMDKLVDSEKDDFMGSVQQLLCQLKDKGLIIEGFFPVDGKSLKFDVFDKEWPEANRNFYELAVNNLLESKINE
jgi:hypothetical protein